jgi:hypothetical protein
MRRRVLVVLFALIAVLGALSVAPVAQAQTSGGTVIACNPNGHMVVASRTINGNVYELLVHNCLEDTVDSFGHWYNTRTHFHCRRNGVAWQGCRVNSHLTLQEYHSGWQDTPTDDNDATFPNTQVYACKLDHSNPGFFADSQTATAPEFANYAFPNGTLIRGAAKDPDNMRFCYADGSWQILDVVSSVSGQWTTQ